MDSKFSFKMEIFTRFLRIFVVIKSTVMNFHFDSE